MTVLGLVPNPGASAGTSTPSILKKAPLKDLVKIATVKLLLLFREDQRNLASGGFLEEKDSISTRGALVVNASIRTRSMDLMEQENANYALVACLFQTSAA